MKLYGGGYWARRKYQRLHSEGRKNGKILRLGQAGKTRRRFFRIKISPAVAFLRRRLLSPRKLLVYLRDAYVNMMMRIANSSAIVGNGGFGFYGGATVAPPFGRPVRKEYDEKIILQIYKTLLAQGKLAPVSVGDGREMIRA